MRVVERWEQLVVLVEDRMEDVEEELERVLIEEVDLMHRLDRKVDRRARVGERHVLLGNRLDLRYHRVSLFHLKYEQGHRHKSRALVRENVKKCEKLVKTC